MSAALEFVIADRGPISREVLRHGFDRFAVLAEHVREFPYGRPVDGGAAAGGSDGAARHV